MMHDGCFFTVKDNKIIDADGTVEISHPAIILDAVEGIVLKVGDIVQSSYLTDYYKTLCTSQPTFAKDFKLVTFNADDILSMDDICSLINYMRNSIGAEECKLILLMSKQSLKDKITKIQEYGF